MKYQKYLWLWTLSLSLSLLLWVGSMMIWDSPSSTMRRIELRGYKRITTSRLDQFFNMHCSQCALVSSSGQMLGTGAGEEIDKTGCVIRMNNAPTKGYEKDVGSRTTVRVVAHTSVPSLVGKAALYYFQQSADTTYVFWGPEKKMRNGSTFKTLLKIAVNYPDVRMYAFTQERVQYCDDVFQNETGKNRLKSGAYLSTGFFTMTLALDMCDSIYVYGMIDDKYCSRANHSDVPYHYYEKSKAKECKVYKNHEHSRKSHRFITEKDIYARWATLHKIEFKHPSWRPVKEETLKV